MTYKQHTSQLWKSIDWTSIIIYLVLIVAGWFTICGASYSLDIDELLAWGSRPMMQLLWMGMGLWLGFVVLMIDRSFFEIGAPIFYIAMMLLLLVTIFVAPDIKGSRSWLVMGPIRLQPAEFAKVATALMLAWQCSKHGFTIKGVRNYATIFALVLLPIVLILGQQETGSALVFLALLLAMYREGFSGLFMGLGASATVYFVLALILQDSRCLGESSSLDNLAVGACILAFTLIFYTLYGEYRRTIEHPLTLGGIALGVYALARGVHAFIPYDMGYVSLGLIILFVGYLLYLAIRHYASRYFFIAAFALGSLGFYHSVNYVFDEIMEPHQQVRIRVALGIEDDIKGKGYNVDQSKIAIGSGGLWGKGFLEGTQTKLNYVPEQDTDFILCTVGEEQGFVGTSALLILYGVFILRIVVLAERQRTTFARVYGYCVASIFFFHLFINAGMVIGLVPVIGIPLPFFSYGGSSLWGFTFLLFIFLGMDARRGTIA